MVSVKDLAKRCGCSTATVSRAFSNPELVKEETQAEIFKVAEEMGYTPNALARGLKNTHSQTIGIIVPSIDNLFYIEILKNIELELHKKNYKLIVSFLQPGIIDERAALDPIVSSRVDGMIILPQNRNNAQYFKRIDKQIRIVQLFTSPYKEYDSVVMQDDVGMEIATDYLLEKNHRRILFFGFSDRVSGYYRSYSKRGLTVCEGLVYTEDRGLSPEILDKAIDEYKPTAIISCSLNSQTVIKRLSERRMRVPEDISFISYDDSEWARIMGITVIAHPLKQITHTVVSTLLERINNPDFSAVPVKAELLPYLIERRSVSLISDGVVPTDKGV